MYEYNTLTEEYRAKSKDRIKRQLELGEEVHVTFVCGTCQIPCVVSERCRPLQYILYLSLV